MNENRKAEPLWRQQALDVGHRDKGFTGLCGLEFTEIKDDGVIISCMLRDDLRNPAGSAHGGLIATMADVAASTMAFQADRVRHPIVTQSCSIHYLRKGQDGRLEAHARLVRKGRRVCVSAVDIMDEEGTLLATATYEIAYLDP